MNSFFFKISYQGGQGAQSCSPADKQRGEQSDAEDLSPKNGQLQQQLQRQHCVVGVRLESGDGFPSNTSLQLSGTSIDLELLSFQSAN